MVQHAGILMASSKADIFCFPETKTRSSERLLNMANKLNFSCSYIVDSLGFAGVLLLIWKSSEINLHVVGHASQIIHTIINIDGKVCLVSFAYVRPNPTAKERF